MIDRKWRICLVGENPIPVIIRPNWAQNQLTKPTREKKKNRAGRLPIGVFLFPIFGQKSEF